MEELVEAFPPTDAEELVKAVGEIERYLRGWWGTVWSCSVSRHASCGPDAAGPDACLLAQEKFDSWFHADLKDGTVADALRDVMRQGYYARAQARLKT